MKKLLILAVIALMMVCCTSPKAEICKYRGDKSAAVSLTFDDGLIDDYTLIAPCLDSLGLHGTFWIVGENIGKLEDRMDWAQCRSLSSRGHEISNHSWSHPHLTNLTAEEISEEVRMCDDIIEKYVGKRPKTFCFPFNAHNELVDSICGIGRVGMRTFQEAQGQANSHSTPESLREWLQAILDAGEWGVTMTHGIHTGWDQWDDSQVLWDFYSEIADMQDSVWVATFAEVAAYTSERDNCTLKLSGRSSNLTIEPVCTLDSSIYTEKLTVRLTAGGKSVLVEVDPFAGPVTFDLNDPLCGKSIVVFGDSYVRNHVRPFTETWHYKVAQRHGMRYFNYGINGNSVAFDRTEQGFGRSMLDRYRTLPEADYVILIAGHNDTYFMTDETSRALELKRMDLLCRGLKEKYPKSKIAWVTPWHVDRPGFDEIIAAIHETCDKYGIAVLDTKTCGVEVNSQEFRDKYFQGSKDTAHLNAEGHDLLVDWGDEFIKQL